MTATSYIHGGNPEYDFQRLGLSPGKILDFSVNVSPLGLPEALIQDWDSMTQEILSYPSQDGVGIMELYEQKYGLNRRYVLPGNGSTECLYLVPRVLKFQRVAIPIPSFNDYERASRLAGAAIIPIHLTPEDGFAAPSQAILEETMRKVDALILGNPNNPTGTLMEPDRILALADQFPDKWILVDEAFIHFFEDYRERTLAREDRFRPNLLIFQSLTKFYALPGLRLGCVIGAESTIEQLKEHKEPWTINGLAEKLAPRLSDCEEYEQQLRSMTDSERQRMRQTLESFEQIRLYHSTANFFMAQWLGSDNLDDLLKALMTRRIYVRDCRNFTGLEQNFFRFSIRTPEENTVFLSALSEVLS